MKMTKQTWTVVGLGLGVGLLTFYLIKKSKAKPQTDTQATTEDPFVTPTTAPQQSMASKKKKEEKTPVTKKPATIWPLQQGSEGKEVERLQIWLLRNHGWKGPVTGLYDEQTDRLVRKRFKKTYLNRSTYEHYQMGIPIHELIKG